MFTVADVFSVRQNPGMPQPVPPPTALRTRAGDRIRRVRELLDLSQEALGQKAGGVNKETVNRIEQGENTTLEKLGRVATALDLTLIDLFSEEEPDLSRHTGTGSTSDDAVPDPTDIRTGYEPDAIPVIAEGEATPDGLVWTTTVTRHVVIEYIARPHDVDDPDAYGLLVIGDSMQPTFRKGHRLVVSPNTPVEDGDEVYVQLTSGERLIKLAFKTETGWRLESLNTKYAAKEVKADDVVAIHTIVWAKRKLPGRRVVDESTGKRR